MCRTIYVVRNTSVFIVMLKLHILIMALEKTTSETHKLSLTLSFNTVLDMLAPFCADSTSAITTDSIP